MNYAEPIIRPLKLIWRHKYVLLLALFGGADVTGGSASLNGFNSPSGGGSSGSTGSSGNFQPPDLNALTALFVALVVILIAVLVVVVILFFLSCLTQGAFTRAIAEHDADRPFGLSSSLRAGLASFGSVLLMRVLALVAGIVTLLPFAVLALAFFSWRDHIAAILLIVVAGIAYVPLFIILSVALGILAILALRTIVLDRLSALAGIRKAVRLLIHRPERIVLVWLIQVALSLGLGLLVAAALIVVAIVFGFGAAMVTSLLRLPLLLAVTVGGIAAVLVSGLIGIVSSSYFSAYWTVAYRRLELDPPAPGVGPRAVPV